jgi:type IV pilus assembly protein PilV
MLMDARPAHTATRGATLIESLVAILIFSIGILAVVALQAAAVKNATTARYRTEASMLADRIVGEMWGDDKTNAVLQANYASPGGAKFAAWKADVEAMLPGAAANPPTITVDASNVVTVTLHWQLPGDSSPHNYILVAQVHG